MDRIKGCRNREFSPLNVPQNTAPLHLAGGMWNLSGFYIT